MSCHWASFSHLMNLWMLHPRLFKVGKGEMKKHVLLHEPTESPLIKSRRLIGQLRAQFDISLLAQRLRRLFQKQRAFVPWNYLMKWNMMGAVTGVCIQFKTPQRISWEQQISSIIDLIDYRWN